MSGIQPETTVRAASSRKRSRAVSNLTEEQIQHKRNVDRKAQRAFRQRNKECITNLEQHFNQLQGTCAELRQSCSQKDVEIGSMREENKSLMNCLEAISELVTTALRQASKAHDEGLSRGVSTESQCSQSGGQQSHTSTSLHQEEPSTESLSAVPQDASLPHQDIGHDMQSPEEPLDNPVGHCQSSPICTDNAATIHDEAHTVSNMMSNEDTICHDSPPADAGLLSPPGSHQAPVTSTHDPHCSSSRISIDGFHMSQHDEAGDYSTLGDMTANLSPYTPSNAVFSILPSHQSSTCPLDLILLEFLKSRREMLSNGMDPELVVGPRKPSARAFINLEQVDSVHPLSGIMSRVLSTFPTVQLAEKLGFFFLMCHTMKWQIHPTKRYYDDMPSWLRPTVTQIAVPHAAWIDNIPWPGVRDILIENPAEYPFQLFSDYYSQNVSVNWKFDGLDAISDLNGEGTLHSIFEKHIGNLKNWTVTQAFQDRFPSMTSAINSHY